MCKKIAQTLLILSVLHISINSYAVEWNSETNCQHRAETVVMLSSKDFAPISADDCRVIYYNKACEYIKTKVLKELRNTPKNNHVAIQSRASTLWRDLVSMSTTAPSKVCNTIEEEGKLPDDFDFGDLDF